MGHYDEAYAEEYEQELKTKKKIYQSMLQDFYEFRAYKHGRNRKWTFRGVVERKFDEIIAHIKAELYDLRNVEIEND